MGEDREKVQTEDEVEGHAVPADQLADAERDRLSAEDEDVEGHALVEDKSDALRSQLPDN